MKEQLIEAFGMLLIFGAALASALAIVLGLCGCSVYEGIRQSQGKEPFSSPFTKHLDKP